jgi:hypothetical protein
VPHLLLQQVVGRRHVGDVAFQSAHFLIVELDLARRESDFAAGEKLVRG